jgi:homoserine dehydrogenase
MKIAILGYGTVGSGVYDIITNQTSPFLTNIKISKILIRKNKEKKLPIMTDSIDDIINDPEIELVVESMGGLTPAYEYIQSALTHKKHVVTANKMVLAQNLTEFQKLAKENNVFLSFEASTAGGIPWIASVEKARRIDNVSKFYGILNGTTNYILDSMDDKGEDFSVALKNAQNLGYAEADPSSDIDGIDVKNKVVISSAIAFNSIIDIEKFPCFGIRNISKTDIDYFKRDNLTIKLIGEAQRYQDKYEAFVMPNLFQRDTIEATVKRNLNIVTLYGSTIGELKFYGQGAGKFPTANAIIQDILDIFSKKTEYTIDINKKIFYDEALSKNKYVIRSCEKMDNSLFNTINKYHDYYYHHTNEITIHDMTQLVDIIERVDTKFFIVKFGNF